MDLNLEALNINNNSRNTNLEKQNSTERSVLNNDEEAKFSSLGYNCLKLYK